MSTQIYRFNKLIAIMLTPVIFAACSAGPIKPEGADMARHNLIQLQSDPQLASRAPVAIQEAELAYLVGSQAASTALAENYVGLPY